MPKTFHAGWFRCRIRRRSKTEQPWWIYFHVTVIGSANELFREARYYSGLYLHRQVFDCERISCRPENLTAIKTINETVFHYQNAVATVPDQPTLDHPGALSGGFK